jgi:hypothetical protein
MSRNKQAMFWVMIGLILAGAFWALGIELTYERNVRRGIPADFRIHRPHSVFNART